MKNSGEVVMTPPLFFCYMLVLLLFALLHFADCVVDIVLDIEAQTLV